MLYIILVIAGLALSVMYQLLFISFFDCIYVRKKNASKVINLVIVLGLISVVFQRIYYINDGIMYLLQTILVLIGMYHIYHVSWLESLYLAFMSRFYIYTIAGIIMSTKSYFLNIPIRIIYYDRQMFGVSFAVARLVTIVAFFVVKHYLIIPNRGRRLTYPLKKIIYTIAIQVIMSFMMLGIMSLYQLELNPLVYIFLFTTSLTINFFSSKLFYEDALKLEVVEKEHNFSNDLKHQIVRQTHHYGSFKEEVDRFKRLDHDYESMLMVLESLIGNTSTTEIEEFIIGFVDEIKQVQELNNKFSNNPIVDSLLSEMSGICKRKGIKFSAKVYLDDGIGINGFDIVRIANNLLRNAIEASMKMNVDERYIKIQSQTNGEWSVFTIENAYIGNLNKNSTSLSSKINDSFHGNGLNIVKEIVNKMDGFCIVDPNDVEKRFKVKIVLKNR